MLFTKAWQAGPISAALTKIPFLLVNAAEPQLAPYPCMLASLTMPL